MSLPDPLTLRALLGPHLGAYTVRPGETAMVGRLPYSDICLMHEGVSRRHAMLSGRAGRWFATDQGSAGGTFLNGVKLRAHEPAPISDADLLRIGPWTFRACIGAASEPGTSTVDDGAKAGQRLSRVVSDNSSLAGRRLRLLTQCIGKLGAMRDEEGLVSAALEVLLQGTGYARVAVLRLGRDLSEVGVVSSRRADSDDMAPFTFSRSLIQAAAGGQTFVLSELPDRVVSTSIAEMGIHSAVCAPVMLGDAAAGFVYLDARAAEQGVERDAAEFCEAVASVLGLAWGNIKRAELESRQAELTAELTAAREVQQVVMPAEDGRIGSTVYSAVSRPGVFVAGDLFDAIELPGDRAAICLGDVAGHGAGSGMLMALTQSHLSAVLRATCDPVAAVTAVNEYLCGYPLSGRFVSLWVGILEPDGLLRFVDAGHGHWFLQSNRPLPEGGGRGDGSSDLAPRPEEPQAAPHVTHGPAKGGIPVAISPDSRYSESRIQLSPGDRVILFSDGVLDQCDPQGEPFGPDRIVAAANAAAGPAEQVRRVFAELDRFAGRANLDDDATVAVIGYEG